MQIKPVLKVVSPTIITTGIAMMLSSVVSMIYQENPFNLIISGIIAAGFGFIIYYSTKKADTRFLEIKEGCAIATFSWVFVCFFGALPFYIMGFLDHSIALSWTKSLYESVSGFSTTGASILTNIEALPKGILFWRSLTHWFGGMGIVVLVVAILPKLGIGGLQGFRMESPGPLKSDKLVPRISQTAKTLYLVYLAITILIIISLKIVGINWYDSFVHAFGTIGTGGFSNYNNSISGLNSVAAEYIMAFFMWLSGVNFTLTYLFFVKGKLKTYWQDSEFKVYTGLTVLAIITITLVLFYKQYNSYSLVEAFRYASFQVPAILTTTGYGTDNFSQWPFFPLSILIILMFIGGSTGSTGGGLKVLRHIINFKLMKQELIKIFQPNRVNTIKIGKRPIDETITISVMALTMIYLLTFAIGAFILTFFNMDLLTAASASIANLGNIGPGLNSVGSIGNYSAVHPVGLWVLMFEMILGRLEIYTVLILFTPAVWKK